MGLISQIEKKSHVKKIETKNFEVAADEGRSTQSEKIQSASNEPCSCPACHGSAWWWDRFGGGPHCQVCRPWPSKALVARTSGESDEKSPARIPGGHQSDPGESVDTKSRRIPDVADMTDDEFDQLYRCYETRPDKDGHGRRLVIERRDWKPEYHMIDQ